MEGVIVRPTLATALMVMMMGTAAWAADGAGSGSPPVDPTAVPCTVVTSSEMEQFVGAPATIKETNDNLCTWAGSKPEAYVQVMYFPNKMRGVPNGQERAYFDQIMGSEKDQYGAAFTEISGIGETAWGLNMAGNAENYFKVYSYKNKDSLTIATNGVGYEATVEIARLTTGRL